MTSPTATIAAPAAPYRVRQLVRVLIPGPAQQWVRGVITAVTPIPEIAAWRITVDTGDDRTVTYTLDRACGDRLEVVDVNTVPAPMGYWSAVERVLHRVEQLANDAVPVDLRAAAVASIVDDVAIMAALVPGAE